MQVRYPEKYPAGKLHRNPLFFDNSKYKTRNTLYTYRNMNYTKCQENTATFVLLIFVALAASS